MNKRIRLDPNSFNRHTEEGMALLEHSIREVGAIESVAVDKNGEIITNYRKGQYDENRRTADIEQECH